MLTNLDFTMCKMLGIVVFNVNFNAVFNTEDEVNFSTTPREKQKKTFFII